MEAIALFFKSTVGKMFAAALVASIVAASIAVSLTSNVYEVKVAKLEKQKAEKTAVDATASLIQLQTFINNMHFAAADYDKSQGVLFGKLDKLAKEFAHASALKPLPLDCKPDVDRLRFLTAAVAAANAASTGH